jgi:hypothetical protein
VWIFLLVLKINNTVGRLLSGKPLKIERFQFWGASGRAGGAPFLPRKWRSKLAYLLIIAAIASGIATYAALTETPPLGNDPDTVIWLLNIDLIILLLLVALIARRIVSLWSGKKRGLAGIAPACAAGLYLQYSRGGARDYHDDIFGVLFPFRRADMVQHARADGD